MYASCEACIDPKGLGARCQGLAKIKVLAHLTHGKPQCFPKTKGVIYKLSITKNFLTKCRLVQIVYKAQAVNKLLELVSSLKSRQSVKKFPVERVKG